MTARSPEQFEMARKHFLVRLQSALNELVTLRAHPFCQDHGPDGLVGEAIDTLILARKATEGLAVQQGFDLTPAEHRGSRA